MDKRLSFFVLKPIKIKQGLLLLLIIFISLLMIFIFTKGIKKIYGFVIDQRQMMVALKSGQNDFQKHLNQLQIELNNIKSNTELHLVLTQNKIDSNSDKLNQLILEQQQQNKDFANFSLTQKNSKNEIIKLMLRQKVEQLVAGLKTDQEKTVSIANWVSLNIVSLPGSADPNEVFTSRIGQCQSRVLLFTEMIKMINLGVRTFNFWNFPTVASNHAAAQVFYDGKWHFFELTFAGYFKKNQQILSFDEILAEAKKGDHLKYLVVQPAVLDKFIDQNTLEPLYLRDNLKEITALYSKQNLLALKSYGFQGEDIIPLYINFDQKQFKQGKYIMKFGNEDKSLLSSTSTSTSSSSSSALLSTGLDILGSGYENFIYHWHFNDLQPGKTYSLKYKIKHASADHLKFKAEAKSAKIIEGEEFNNDKIWEIKFVPVTTKPIISILYDHRLYHYKHNRQFLVLEEIEINEENNNTFNIGAAIRR